ncbi:MAG: hypothetical protein BWY02_00864 [bacterium ADurb.Bin157]|nr:MAG: hypothetical protein BWY02_00864 [bacterium ADurb.Bin157]
MNFKILITVFIMLVFSFSILTAQNPTTFNAIEVFPGAKIDPEKSKYEKELFDEIYSDSATIKDKDIKVFVTDAPVDEVAGWFNKKLKAVDYNADYYDDNEFEMQYERDTLIYDGQWVKKSISDRKKSSNGKVMMSANYMWEITNEDDERSEFTIFVDDASFDYENKKYKQKTSIKITFCHFAQTDFDLYNQDEDNQGDYDLSDLEDSYDLTE